MILPTVVFKPCVRTCPHTRGDDPFCGQVVKLFVKLVPTRVGMIPYDMCRLPCRVSCPHTRGDDPTPSPA